MYWLLITNRLYFLYNKAKWIMQRHATWKYLSHWKKCGSNFELSTHRGEHYRSKQLLKYIYTECYEKRIYRIGVCSMFSANCDFWGKNTSILIFMASPQSSCTITKLDRKAIWRQLGCYLMPIIFLQDATFHSGDK